MPELVLAAAEVVLKHLRAFFLARFSDIQDLPGESIDHVLFASSLFLLNFELLVRLVGLGSSIDPGPVSISVHGQVLAIGLALNVVLTDSARHKAEGLVVSLI